jgi:DNA-binding transcriptional ArsR family regulator
MAIGKSSISVSEIIHATELPQTLVSFHLKALRNADVVKTKRNGPFIYYSLSSPNLIDILDDLSQTNDTAATADGRHFETGPDKQSKIT